MLLESAGGVKQKKKMQRTPTSLPSLSFSDRYCICWQSERTPEEDADIEPSLPNSRCGRIRRLATLPLIPGLTALPTGRQEQHTHLVERSKMAIWRNTKRMQIDFNTTHSMEAMRGQKLISEVWKRWIKSLSRIVRFQIIPIHHSSSSSSFYSSSPYPHSYEESLSLWSFSWASSS